MPSPPIRLADKAKYYENWLASTPLSQATPEIDRHLLTPGRIATGRRLITTSSNWDSARRRGILRMDAGTHREEIAGKPEAFDDEFAGKPEALDLVGAGSTPSFPRSPDRSRTHRSW